MLGICPFDWLRRGRRSADWTGELRRHSTGCRPQATLLGTHLREAVRTGRQCIYLPEPGIALSWAVSAGDTSPS